MSNKRFEMYEYRQIIYRLQQGQKARAISRDGLASRSKVAEIREVAEKQGWLLPEAILPDEKTLSELFCKNPIPKQESKVEHHSEMIEQWLQQGIRATVIHQHLKNHYGYTGAYNSIQRFAKKIKTQIVKLTVPLSFQPGEAAQVIMD